MNSPLKVFFSFHEADVANRDRLIELLADEIIENSVHQDDIEDDQLLTETVEQRIRDEHVADSDVTVVLVGPCTWKRKHVDWEIHSSLRDTANNPRNGVLAIVLKNHRDHWKPTFKTRLIPPRLADNLQGNDPFAKIYSWPRRGVKRKILRWIEEAYTRREGHPPTNNRTRYGENQRGRCSEGWQPERDLPDRLQAAH